MKVRWYHWLIYRLYHRLWTPIYSERPWMVEAQIDYMQSWLTNRRNRKAALKVVTAMKGGM